MGEEFRLNNACGKGWVPVVILRQMTASGAIVLPLTSTCFSSGREDHRNHGELDLGVTRSGFFSHGDARLRCPIKATCHGKRSWLTAQPPYLWVYHLNRGHTSLRRLSASNWIRWGCYSLAVPTWCEASFWPGWDFAELCYCLELFLLESLFPRSFQVSDLQRGLKVLPTCSCSQSLYPPQASLRKSLVHLLLSWYLLRGSFPQCFLVVTIDIVRLGVVFIHWAKHLENFSIEGLKAFS